jgi:hypothetical protein
MALQATPLTTASPNIRSGVRKRLACPHRGAASVEEQLHSGSLTYLLGGQKVVIPARQVSAFWAGLPHQIVEFESTSA